MEGLLEALRREARGEFDQALVLYQGLLGAPNPVDRLGIVQAVARCSERLGRFREAAPFHRDAAQMYLEVEELLMKQVERTLHALLEYRQCLQDASGDLDYQRSVIREYQKTLQEGWDVAGEQLSHEALYAAALFELLGDSAESGRYYFLVGDALGETTYEKPDATVLAVVRSSYENAAEAFTKAGEKAKADLARKRALALVS